MLACSIRFRRLQCEWGIYACFFWTRLDGCEQAYWISFSMIKLWWLNVILCNKWNRRGSIMGGCSAIEFWSLGLDWEWSHLVSNCKSCKLSFQILESEFKCKSCKRLVKNPLFPLATISQTSWLCWCAIYYAEHNEERSPHEAPHMSIVKSLIEPNLEHSISKGRPHAKDV